mmetsp:Transcript_36304/g.43724  ORF Transcript_36304/g.43724 Transcript_36304/m.43724 type:complete len:84 (+) Transcript_36304:104-355(+)
MFRCRARCNMYFVFVWVNSKLTKYFFNLKMLKKNITFLSEDALLFSRLYLHYVSYQQRRNSGKATLKFTTADMKELNFTRFCG